MAQNDLKANRSASEDEETSGSEDELTSGSGSDEISGEKQKQEPKKALIAPRQFASKPQASDSSSSETGESGSDTDSDATVKSSAVVNTNVKPISSRPMEREQKRNLESKLAKKDASKMTSTSPLAKSKRPPPAPAANGNDAKKAKQNTGNAELKKALIAPSLSSSETEESGSDSDSGLPPKKPAVVNSIVKPTERKAGPNLESELAKTDGSKMTSTQSSAKIKRPPPAPAANENDAKKAKQNTANAEPKKAVSAPSHSANKPQPPDLSSSETGESGSDGDSDVPPKKSAVVNPNVKPVTNLDFKLAKEDGSEMTSSSPTAKSKRPPPSPAANEKDAKKDKQNTANAKRLQVAYLYPSEEEDSFSDTDSNSPSKKSTVAKSKLTPPALKANEKDTKKAKQNTSNGDPKKVLVTPSQPVKKPQAPYLYSSEAEESCSDSESDPNIKPVSSEPIEREGPNQESKLAQKDGPKTVSTQTSLQSKLPPPASNANENLTKRTNKNPAVDDDSKKQLFQRLWSVDDEIVILEGMIDYKNLKNGLLPFGAEMDLFHEFIKKFLHVDVSRAQLVDKIRRLKKKYVNNASKKKHGKNIRFTKCLELKVYELSKLIWGSNSHDVSTERKKIPSQRNGNSKGTSTGTAANMMKSNEVDDKEKPWMEFEKKMDISRFFRNGGMNEPLILPEEIVKAGMELLDGCRRTEMEEKWKKLKEQELMLYVRRMELLKEQALLVLEAISSSGN